MADPIDIRFSTLTQLDRDAFNGASLDSLIAHIEEFTFVFDMQEKMLTVCYSDDNEPPSEHSRPCTSISGAQELANQVLQSTPSQTLTDLGWTVVL